MTDLLTTSTISDLPALSRTFSAALVVDHRQRHQTVTFIKFRWLRLNLTAQPLHARKLAKLQLMRTFSAQPIGTTNSRFGNLADLLLIYPFSLQPKPHSSPRSRLRKKAAGPSTGSLEVANRLPAMFACQYHDRRGATP